MTVNIPQDTQQWVATNLAQCDFVTWDRFTVTDDSSRDDGIVVSVFGWIPRDDDHEEFVTTDFWDARDIIDFKTSSPDHTERLHRILVGDGLETHNDCQRVENTFAIENCVETDEPEIATDGGTAKDSPIPMSKGFDCGNCGARYRDERIARVCCNGCGGVAS